MIKISLGIFILLNFQISFSQNEIKDIVVEIKGKIKCVGKYRVPPDFEIIVLDEENNQLGEPLKSDTRNHPYYFSGRVNKPETGDVFLKFVSNSQDSLNSYPEPLLKFSNFAQIKVKNIKHIRDDYFSNAESHFQRGRFQKAVDLLLTFIDFEYSNAFNDSHDYKWSYFLARAYEAQKKYDRAIETLNNLLVRVSSLEKTKKHSVYKYLNRLFLLNNDLQNHSENLDKMASDINIESMSISNLESYFKNRLTNLLRRADYFNEKHQRYPGKYLADSLENGQAKITKEEWKTFYNEWTASRLGDISYRDFSLLEQIEKAIEVID